LDPDAFSERNLDPDLQVRVEFNADTDLQDKVAGTLSWWLCIILLQTGGRKNLEFSSSQLGMGWYTGSAIFNLIRQRY
jgi:hypothetical protein